MNDTPNLTFGRRFLHLCSLTIQHIAITISCSSFCLLVLALCAGFSPWLELAVHFSAHALIGTIAVTPILWFTGHRRTAVVCCGLGACFAVFVQPWYLMPLGGKPSLSEPNPHQLKVLSWNMLATNEEFDLVEQFIRKVDPDVLILIEVRPDMLDHVPWLTEHFPSSKVLPSWSGGGIAVFSRTAASEYSVEFNVENFATRAMPSIVTTITNNASQRRVDLIATHTFSPTPPPRAALRDKQLRMFLEWSNARQTPHCLVGDLNTTPWTTSFWELERAGFRDSRRGAGNCASWPAFLGFAGIPIDHALTRGECSITKRRVHGIDGGSDHRPIEFYLHF